MTDNEIIRILERAGLSNGSAIGHHSGTADIIAERFIELLDENNHQKAEIEMLTQKVNESVEIIQASLRLSEQMKNEIKSEAIKEFAGRLIDIAVGNWNHEVSIATIDNLVKEMTEE